MVVDRRDDRGERCSERGYLWSSKRSAIVSGIGRKGYFVREECFDGEERGEERRGFARIYE